MQFNKLDLLYQNSDWYFILIFPDKTCQHNKKRVWNYIIDFGIGYYFLDFYTFLFNIFTCKYFKLIFRKDGICICILKACTYIGHCSIINIWYGGIWKHIWGILFAYLYVSTCAIFSWLKNKHFNFIYWRLKNLYDPVF